MSLSKPYPLHNMPSETIERLEKRIASHYMMPPAKYDPYTSLASDIFNTRYNKVSSRQRKLAKQFSYRAIYGGNIYVTPDSIN